MANDIFMPNFENSCRTIGELLELIPSGEPNEKIGTILIGESILTGEGWKDTYPNDDKTTEYIRKMGACNLRKRTTRYLKDEKSNFQLVTHIGPPLFE